MNSNEETTREHSAVDSPRDLPESRDLRAWEATFGKADDTGQNAGEVRPASSRKGTNTRATAAGGEVPPGGKRNRRRTADTERDWAPLPQNAEMSGPDQQDYPPIPGFTGRVVDSTVRLSGCSRPVAALGAIGALAALAAWDWNVATLAPDPKPVSIHVLASSETTWRKSTAWEPLWRPHLESDEDVEAAWLEAKAQFANLSDEDRPRGCRPRAHNPQMTRGELTIEALKVRLATGRPCQALYSDEAGEVLRWSFQGSRINGTLSFLSKVFDGRELYDDKLVISREIALRRYRFQVVLAGQGPVIVPLITHPAASNGFSGRVLIAKDDRRPPRSQPPDENDREVLRQYSRMIRAHRRRQDLGLELAETAWAEPQILRINPDAQAYLARFHQEMETKADDFHNEGRVHEQGFAGRAAELAARLAAVFSGVDWYEANPGGRPGAEDGHPGLVEVRAACEVVKFHLHELGRIIAISGNTELGSAVEKVIEWIKEALLETRGGGVSRHVDERGHVALVRLINDRMRTGKLRDPEYRRRVIGVLENEPYVRPATGRRGWYEPHPDL